MIDAKESIIQTVSVHHIGNLALEQGLKISDAPLELDDDRVHNLLQTYFLSSFTSPEYNCFSSEDGGPEQNSLFSIASAVFDEPALLHEYSVKIADLLYEASNHPNIKEGDLFVVYFGTLPLHGQHTEAIGIFKSETKDAYLKLKAYANQFDLAADEGINVRKLDKGCIILNLEKESGYKVLVVDNSNRTEATFWRENFLSVKPLSDAYHQTHQFMNLAHDFVENRVPQEFEVSRADQIDLLNKSVNFFKSKEQFNKAEFETEVLADADVIQSFRQHEKNFFSNAELDPEENFEISAMAVKQQARVFKTVLKLDKNFHIYIHGNRELIEKGFDEVTGKHYYKLYFDSES